MDTMNPVLADERIREAIGLSLDKEAIMKDIMGGGDVAAMMVVTAALGHNPALKPYLMAIGLSGGDVVDASEHGSCLFVLCIDPSAFRPIEEFDQTVESTADRLKAIPPAEGFDEVLLPGEPEARSRAARSRDGIPLPDKTWEALVSVARELGVSP